MEFNAIHQWNLIPQMQPLIFFKWVRSLKCGQLFLITALSPPSAALIHGAPQRPPHPTLHSFGTFLPYPQKISVNLYEYSPFLNKS